MPYLEEAPPESGRFVFPVFVVRPGGAIAAFTSEGQLERHLDLSAATDGSVAWAADGRRLRLVKARRWERAYYVVPIPADVVALEPADDGLPRVAELRRVLLEWLSRHVEEPRSVEHLTLEELVELGLRGAGPPSRMPWHARPWA